MIYGATVKPAVPDPPSGRPRAELADILENEEGESACVLDHDSQSKLSPAVPFPSGPDQADLD
jgi:hypothetical protein